MDSQGRKQGGLAMRGTGTEVGVATGKLVSPETRAI